MRWQTLGKIYNIMGRGLGHIQKALLQYFAELPEGGGKWYLGWCHGYSDLLHKFKVKQWPEVYGEDKPLYFKDNVSYYAHIRAVTKARVTTHNAVHGLLRRGLLRSVPEYDPDKKWQALEELHITEEGKLIINALPGRAVNK